MPLESWKALTQQTSLQVSLLLLTRYSLTRRSVGRPTCVCEVVNPNFLITTADCLLFEDREMPNTHEFGQLNTMATETSGWAASPHGRFQVLSSTYMRSPATLHWFIIHHWFIIDWTFIIQHCHVCNPSQVTNLVTRMLLPSFVFFIPKWGGGGLKPHPQAPSCLYALVTWVAPETP